MDQHKRSSAMQSTQTMAGVYHQWAIAKLLPSLAFALLPFYASPAFAQQANDPFKTEIFLSPDGLPGYTTRSDAQYPKLNGRFLLLTGDTRYFSVRDASGALNTSHWSSIQPTSEVAFALQLSPHFSILAKSTLGSFDAPPEDNAFSNLGIELNNLFAAYRGKNYAFYTGKVDLGFGDGWHVIDGVYNGFTEDFKYPGALSIGGRFTFASVASGTHSLAAALFKRDDTILGRRFLFNDGLEPSHDTSLPGYATLPESFILSYDVKDIPGLNGFSGGVDVGRLQAGSETNQSANAVSIRMLYGAAITKNWRLSLFNEATFADAFQGKPVITGNAVSSVSLSRDSWQFTVTAAARKLSAEEDRLADFGFASDWDWGVSGTVTYATPFAVILQAGVMRQRDQSLTLNQGVFRVAYQAGF